MAKTVFWYCPKCGFANKPHPYRKDNSTCEQCGHPQDDELALDYKPAGAI